MSGSSDADNDTLSPAADTALKCRPHHSDVAGAVKGIITPTVGHLNQLFLHALLTQLGGVDKVGCPEFLAPALLAIVDIDDNDFPSAILDCALDDAEANAAGSEHRNIGSLLDATPARGDHSCAVSSRDATAEQAGTVHRRVVLDGHNGNVRHYCVLGEGGCTHEVQQLLALALEPRRAIRHDTFALGCADLAA